LTLSKQSKEELVKLGINPNKITVFTYWVNLNKFKPIKDAKNKLNMNNKFIVFCASRLVPEKGIGELLEASAMWNRKIYLLIASDGPMRDVVKDYAKKYKNIIYVGRLSSEELVPYFSAANITIIPSVHEEGFGRVILESLACGTPVIGSNRGAIPEAMDETVGRLIDVTPENIKTAAEYFYKYPSKLEKLSNNTRSFALEKYSEKNVESIITKYKNT
jgi:glycosyltransferase involved in cell wall biosynthesis